MFCKRENVILTTVKFSEESNQIIPKVQVGTSKKESVIPVRKAMNARGNRFDFI